MKAYKIQKPIQLYNDPVREWIFYEENGYTFADIFAMVSLKDIDFEKWSQSRYDNAMAGIKEGVPLPPVRLYFDDEKGRYSVSDGNHRVAASIDSGFTHIPAIVSKKFKQPIHPKPSENKLQEGKLAEECLHFKLRLEGYCWQNGLNAEFIFDNVTGNQYTFLVSNPQIYEEQRLVISAENGLRRARLSWQGKNFETTGTLDQIKVKIYEFLSSVMKKNSKSWYNRSLIQSSEMYEMYETFGLEDILARSFFRHYDNFIKGKAGTWQGLNQITQIFSKEKVIYIGTSNISGAVKPIIERYGAPKTQKIPNRIKFAIVHPDIIGEHKDANAFFSINKDGDHIIGVVSDNLTNIFHRGIEELKLSIDHELQHFLRALYEGGISEKAIKEGWKSDWEMQAYCRAIAKDAINVVKLLFNEILKHATPERMEKVINKLKSEKDNITEQYVGTEVKKFLELNKNKQLTKRVRQEYYKHSLINFGKFFDQWINSISA